MIRTNTLKVLRVTRERKVGIITFFPWLLVTPSMYSYVSLVFVIIPTFRSLVTRSTFDVFVRIIGICYNSYLSYEDREGDTSNQGKKGKNYNKYQ
jgi:hypothetical protein